MINGIWLSASKRSWISLPVGILGKYCDWVRLSLGVDSTVEWDYWWTQRLSEIINSVHLKINLFVVCQPLEIWFLNVHACVFFVFCPWVHHLPSYVWPFISNSTLVDRADGWSTKKSAKAPSSIDLYPFVGLINQWFWRGNIYCFHFYAISPIALICWLEAPTIVITSIKAKVSSISLYRSCYGQVSVSATLR